MIDGFKCTPGPWTYCYSPYTANDGEEIPAFEVHGEDKICDTNEDRPAEEQEANARLLAAAWDLMMLLDEGFNITHDIESTVRKGYLKDWHARVRAKLAELGVKGVLS